LTDAKSILVSTTDLRGSALPQRSFKKVTVAAAVGLLSAKIFTPEFSSSPAIPQTSDSVIYLLSFPKTST
jgi:hypothetical protein